MSSYLFAVQTAHGDYGHYVGLRSDAERINRSGLFREFKLPENAVLPAHLADAIAISRDADAMTITYVQRVNLRQCRRLRKSDGDIQSVAIIQRGKQFVIDCTAWSSTTLRTVAKVRNARRDDGTVVSTVRVRTAHASLEWRTNGACIMKKRSALPSSDNAFNSQAKRALCACAYGVERMARDTRLAKDIGKLALRFFREWQQELRDYERLQRLDREAVTKDIC